MEGLKTPIASLRPSESTSLRKSSSDHDQASFPAQRAAVLFGCFRKGDANDPETYTAAVTAILAEYPEEVIQFVTDPRTGIARKNNWLPTLAEVDAACIEHAQFVEKRDQLVRKGWQLIDGKWIKPEAA